MPATRFLKFALILNVLNNIECTSMIIKNQNIIKSLIEQLNVKHIIIIKNYNFQLDHQILNFVKQFHEIQVSVNCLYVNEMIKLMNKYYMTPKGQHFDTDLNRQLLEKHKKVKYLVFPPKTIVLITGENVQEIITNLFQVNKKSYIQYKKLAIIISRNY